MRRAHSFVVALAVLALAPLPVLAQGGGQGQGRGGMGGQGGMMGARALLDHGSVEYLVTKAADLQLTAEQTTQLTAIGAAWSAATKDARAQVGAAMPQPGQGAGGGDPQAMRQRFQELMPVLQKLQADDQASLEEGLKVLTETQQQKAKQLLDERMQAMRPRR